MRTFRARQSAAVLLAGAGFLAGCDEGGTGPGVPPTVVQTATPTAGATLTATATSQATATATSPPATEAPTPTATTAGVIAYDLVAVGNPGNANDASGYGGVAYDYRIGKYEVTIGQYAAFLNAVAATDTHSLYRPAMAGDQTVAGIVQGGSNGSYTYSVIGPSGIAPPGASSGSDRPISYVSWFNAARFANWMANGQPAGLQDDATTENGAYDLNGATTGNAVGRNDMNPNTGSAPTFHLPTENEWYKAAYYSPLLEGGSGGYHKLATQSDAPPNNVIGSGTNQANHINDNTGYSVYSVTQLSNLDPNQNYLSEVGAFTSSGSFYGTFDQNGSVWEWNDLDGSPGPSRALRGGAWTSTPPYLQSSLRLGYTPVGVTSNGGFRLAAPAAASGPAADDAALSGPAGGASSIRRDDRVSATMSGSTPARAAGARTSLDATQTGVQAVTIDMVTVGNAGNDHDATGYGGVDYDYRIGKYEVTIGQYAAFLNAVAAADPYALYNPRMAADLAIAGITRTGSPGSYAYSAIDNGGSSANRPVTYVSWWDAARFANWMANGQPTGLQDDATTENGAYDLNGATGGTTAALNAVNPNTGEPPAFSLPLENEWYKAAYYDPTLDGGAGGYYEYATQSDVAPDNVLGSAPNQANYFAGGTFSVTHTTALEPNQNYLTDVGAFTDSGSFYGTFDQTGGVWEWNDLDGAPSVSRGLRGGYWFSGSLALQASLFCNDTAARENNDIGFRLASPVALEISTATGQSTRPGQPASAQ